MRICGRSVDERRASSLRARLAYSLSVPSSLYHHLHHHTHTHPYPHPPTPTQTRHRLFSWTLYTYRSTPVQSTMDGRTIRPTLSYRRIKTAISAPHDASARWCPALPL